MAKQLNVNLAFTADATQAKAQLNSLKKSLDSLVNDTALKTPNFKFTQDIQEATRAASQLKVQLASATNVNTGNLDLTKFSEQMRKSGMSLEKYQNQLYQLGPAGEKAFADLAQAITKAEVPMRRSSKMLGELWTTMKNTARWQLSSSALHAFMGAIQSAYGYAQDLNRSLNDIRIVTGASVDKMSEFAQEANAAAKALSTTTTEYTKASLIFYQQGLSDSEVKDRTDITIKMANASGQSAEIVSDQLTAVWNNFYDGSKSLEYYADVMTALGAATASSAEEIAGGLEKFAAIGDTIGLSYEYAASALATITSNTRQSEEVVGTALKTIFARIQGLNLGETLEDGVTLNKYSEALEKVGISIFDSAGQLKNMDSILTEMAATWDTLNKGQQTALAQTVAGVRQYTQLVALMENWDNGDSDSMMANLQTTSDAEGALQDQADIYAESWEAAQKRVQASAETVYSAILNDEFFIDLTNGFAGLLEGVQNFIDGLGGIKGVLLAVGSLVTNIFSKQIGQSIQNAMFNLKAFVNPKAIEQKEIEQKKHANELLISGMKDTGTTSGAQSAEAYAQIGRQQIDYIQNVERMSEEEKLVNQQLMDRNRLLADEAIAAGKALEKTEEKILLERKSLQVQVQRKSKDGASSEQLKALKNQQLNVEKLSKSYSTLNAVANKVELVKNLPDEEFQKLKIDIDAVIKSMAGVDGLNTQEDFEKLANALGLVDENGKTAAKRAKELYEAFSKAETLDGPEGLRAALADLENTSLSNSISGIQNLKEAIVKCGIDADTADAIMEDYLTTIEQFGPESVEAAQSLNKLKTSVSSLSTDMQKTKQQPMELGQAFSKAASAVMGIGQAFTTVKGIIDVFNDSEATTGDKVMALVSGIGMLIPAIMAIAPAFSTASVSATLFGTTATAAGTAASLAMWQVTLIVAGIAAIVGIIAFLVTQESAAEKALGQARKASEELEESLEDAKEAANKLRDSFDGYKSAVEKLESCTKGTQEWKEALEEVNRAALEVIDNLPSDLTADEIRSLYNRDKGYIELDEDKIAEYQGRLDATVNAAEYANSFGKIQVTLAEAEVEIESFAKKLDISSDKLASSLKQLTGLTNDEFRDALEKLGVEVDNLTNDTLEKYQKKIEDLATSTDGANEKLKLIAALQVDQQLGDDYDAATKEMSANMIASETKRLAAELLDKYTGDGIAQNSQDDNEIYQEILKDLKAAGYDYDAWTQNEVRGTDSSRSFAFSGANGEEVVRTAEWVANTVAASKALQDLGQSAQKATEFLNKIEGNIGETNADIMKGFVVDKNFLGATYEDFSKFYSDIAGTYDTTNFSQSDVDWYMDKKLGGDGKDGHVSDTTAAKWGYDNHGEMSDAIYEALKLAKEAWESLEIDGLNHLNTLSIGTAQAIDNIYQDLNLGPLGEEAGKQFVEGLNKMTATLSPDEAKEALEKLSKVDWSEWDALEQAKDVMKEYGVTIDTSSEYWQNFANNMRLASRSIPDFSQIKKDLTEVSAILNDLDFGSVISDEDYERLVAYNDEWERFFILQADGTRKFIGSAEEMQQEIRDNIEAQKKDLESRQKIQQGVEDKGWGYTSEGGVWKDVDWYKAGEDFTLAGTAQNLINKSSDDPMGQLLDLLGYSDEAIQTLIDDYNAAVASGDEEAIKAAEERLKEMYNAIGDFMNEDLDIAGQELDEMMASTASNFAELNRLLAEGSINQESYNKQAQYLTYTNMQAAESLSELNAAWQEGLATGAELNYDVYADNLLRLAENYSICAEEASEFSNALKSGNEEAIKAAEDTLEASIMLAEAAEKYGVEAKELSIQSKQLAKAYGISEKAAAQLTIENQRMNVGVANMVNNWETWSEELKKADKTSRDWAWAASECTAAIADLVGASEDLELPAEFFESAENMLLLEQAAKGSEEAIEKLGIAVAKAQVDMMTFQSGMTNLEGQLIQESEFNTWKDTVLDGINELQFALDNVDVGDNVYEKLGGDEWVSALNEMAIATNMSVEQMNSMLNSMGVQAEVVTKNVPQKIKVPVYRTEQTDQEYDQHGNIIAYNQTTRQIDTKTMDGMIQVAQINTGDSVGEEPKITYVGGGKVSQSAKDGKTNPGDSSKGSSKKGDRTKKSEVVERYKEINDQLDDVSKKAQKAEQSLDRLYGEDQNAAIQDLIEAQKEEQGLLEDKRRLAQTYLAQDMAALEAAALKAGVFFTFDENGNIANYTSQMTKLYNELAAAEIAAGEEWTESEQEQIEAIQDKISNLEEAQQAYEETLSTIEDINLELEKFKGAPPLPVVTADLVDIYKEVNDELDDIEETMEQIDREADRAYGSARVKALKDSAKIEQEKLATLKEQAKVNQQNIAETQAALLTRGSHNGLSFTFDENGNIENFNEQMKILTDNYRTIYNQLAADGGISDADQQILDALQADIDELSTLADAYTEAVEEGEEILKEQEAAFDAWQSKNFEALSYDLEIRIDIDEDKLELVDYYLNKMDGDVFQMGESLALMTGDKMNSLIAQTETYQQKYLELQQAFQNGEISAPDYYEALDQIKDGLLTTAEAMQELDKLTLEYYGNTLQAAQEEIDKYVENMDHLANVLNHYQTILDLSTLEKNSDQYYKNMDTVLEGQLATAENAVEVSKATMDMFKQELAAKEAAYQEALQSGDEETIKARKKHYEDALAAANAAEEEYLTRVEEYAEKATQILEHNLKKFANTLEDKLTGGTSFNQMNTGMERFLSLHEEYLTTTNKVYETSKLMRAAQQEIDKTSNTVAKNKMKQFVKETQSLQDQNKLSQFELDIQQAKYDLLVAEIALEEAKNAKSQVRLQRDNEGNFGYVYTADQEMMQNAEQQYLDAQNELYNIGLEGANNYVQKYQETMQEMYDTLTSLADAYRNGEFESEAEYRAAVEEATQYYYEKLDQYSYLHYQAIQTDDRVATDYILSNSNLARTGIHGDTLMVGDSWRTTFLDISGFGEDAKAALTGQSWDIYQRNKEDLEGMEDSAETWKDAVIEYVGLVDTEFTKWKDNIADNVSPAVENLGEKVSAVVTASENFTEALTGDDGLISQLKEELRQVTLLTNQYLQLRNNILEAISAAEQAAQQIIAEKEQTVDPPEITDPPETPTNNPPTNNPPTNNPPTTDTGDDGTGGSPTTQGDGSLQVGDVVTYVKGQYYYDSYGTAPAGSRGIGKKATITKLAPGNPYPIHLKSSDSAYGWLKKDQIAGYDTGGYTGDWSGPDGKFAVLHKKELVLNSNDTENFLASMEVLERILQAIDLQSANQLYAREMSSPQFSTVNSDVLEQKVSIEASFPNVSDKNEIEEAFKDLVNLASQYAYRK